MLILCFYLAILILVQCIKVKTVYDDCNDKDKIFTIKLYNLFLYYKKIKLKKRIVALKQIFVFNVKSFVCDLFKLNFSKARIKNFNFSDVYRLVLFFHLLFAVQRSRHFHLYLPINFNFHVGNQHFI